MIVALARDLLDRSRLRAALGEVTFASDPDECAGATVVLVDLAHHADAVAAVRRGVPDALVVAFGPHVDTEGARRARDAGADAAVPRSRLFRDPAATIRALGAAGPDE